MNGNIPLFLAVLTVGASVAGAVTEATGLGTPLLQYGAFGLCAMMVASAVWSIRLFMRHLEKKDRQMTEMVDRFREDLSRMRE